MDVYRRKKSSSSGGSFSFPRTTNQDDSDFEFGSLTPDSPSCRTSPADHLFLNGILQPHSFPVFQPNQNHSAATSRTSSIGSKDSSWLSSRSNSTNSSCSSARTSSSDSSERRLFHNKMNKGVYKTTTTKTGSGHHHQAFGCSQRWQYITPVPVLNREASKRRRKEEAAKKKKKNGMRVRVRFGRRILRWFVMACRECHALEPAKVKNNNNHKVATKM